MPHAHDTRIVPHGAAQMFDLVADIRRYPEFLPWCKALRVRSEETDEQGRGLVTADMVARFKGFEERFTTRVTLDKPGLAIDVAYIDGPFKRLVNAWRFQPLENGSQVDFDIDFEFRSRVLQLLAKTMMEKALLKLSDAFVHRADALYGVTCSARSSLPQPPST
ncbi:MAG: type II toxin-antitoxin system RatA family toxin [Micropepsaceae bacterium]